MWYLNKIPKIAHFYWGNHTVSYFRYLTIYSFKKYNPDWVIRLYYPKIRYTGGKTWYTAEHSQQFSGLNYFQQLFSMGIEKIEVDFSNYGMDNYMPETFKADFLRWYLLATCGGLWSDFDIIYYKPMDHLYLNYPGNHHLDTLVCLQNNNGEIYHSIGFLLGSAHNPFYLFANSQTYRMLDLNNYQSIGSAILNQFFPTMDTIRQHFPHLHVDNISPEVVYPIDYTMVPYIFHTPYMHYLSERTIGLHWFAGHPEAIHFENVIDEHSQIGYNNIISQLIRQVI